jgi:trans-aconitate 2-methyltransferase
MSDWNATSYHEVSKPQQAWGRRVLDRIPLEGHEHALDIGCGTARLTAALAHRLPRGRVVGVDRSQSMLATAAEWLKAEAPGTTLVLADAAALPFTRAFDVVVSNATFHWVHDHGALFRSVITALRPGGRLVAQCGGGPNIALLHARAERMMRTRYLPWFDGWRDPWHFADVESTRRRLAAAGFADVDVSLEAAPTTFPDARAFADFVTTVCVRNHLSRLPRADREAFVNELTIAAAGDSPAFTLDYWRLNIAARRPRA